MIKTFKDKDTEAVFKGGSPRHLPPDILRTAERKLKMVNAAADLRDLRIPPNNSLERLKKDREGQYSIRVNQAWRVCFVFENGEAYDVELTDYH